MAKREDETEVEPAGDAQKAGGEDGEQEQGKQEQQEQQEKDDRKEQTAKRFEIFFGLTLSIFAAVLAVNELSAGKYGDDELKLASEKTSAYLWYQSKGIKETLTEGQRDLLQSLVDGGVIPADKAVGVKKHVASLDERIVRYGKEKKEILLGSAGVGKEGWAQEVDGELGKVIGVKDQERDLDKLGRAGDKFDLATLFLQLCLVAGALGLLVSRPGMKRAFLGAMVLLGSVGAVFFVLAMKIAL